MFGGGTELRASGLSLLARRRSGARAFDRFWAVKGCFMSYNSDDLRGFHRNLTVAIGAAIALVVIFLRASIPENRAGFSCRASR
jgi:hypothetical protein